MISNDKGTKGNTEWEFEFETGTLTIRGAGEMAVCRTIENDYKKLTFPDWDMYIPLIRKIIIEEGVTSICEDAFCNHLLLESVKIADSVKEIGGWAFRHCTSLRSIEIPAGVEKIDCFSFINCYNLEAINVVESNKHYYSKDGVLFTRTGNLVRYPEAKKGEKYDIPAGTKAVLRGSFVRIHDLTEVTFPESLERLEPNAFVNTTCLKAAIVPDGMKEIGKYNYIPLTTKSGKIITT